MHRPPQTFARFVPTPENRAALLAVRDVARSVCGRRRPLQNPLFLHGPTGTGKTHLAAALVEQVTRRRPNLAVAVLPASDLTREGEGLPSPDCDLAVVEDLQHLPPQAVETLVRLLDAWQAR